MRETVEKMVDIHEAMLRLVEAHEGVDASLGYVTEDDFDAFITAAKTVVEAWKSIPRPDTISVRMTERELEMVSVAAGFYAMTESEEGRAAAYRDLAKRFVFLQRKYRDQAKVGNVGESPGSKEKK